jgi:fido (protein-threonine AMPylation protein)
MYGHPVSMDLTLCARGFLLGLCWTFVDCSLQPASLPSNLPILFSRKEWLFGADEPQPIEILQKVQDFLGRSEIHPYERVFSQRALVAFVYSSNKMERTLPHGVSEQEAFQCLEKVFDEDAESDDVSHSVLWRADGGDRGEMRAQMTQHCKALRLAGEWSRDSSHTLDADKICRLHKTLMLNSKDDEGHLIKAGEIRKTGAFTTGHIYPEASFKSLEHAIGKYKASVERDEHFLLQAATLFYEVIQAHPFQDGNGRLCRLLLNYVLERAGFPFAVPLTSGHSRSRKHYILAIQAAQHKDLQAIPVNQRLSDLTSLILKSCYYKIINFEANTRRMITD